ncbi:hypothetical protein [Desulfonema ishimotonii]|nr:hypothetical protein [Desulfonema ishimotonii]
MSFLLGTLCLVAFWGHTAAAENISFNELPADARMAISKALGDDLPDAYGIRADGEGFRTENPAHGLEIGFDAEGVLIRDGKHACEWRMTLTGLGYGTAQPVASATMAVAGNRAEYRRGDALTEWYLNTPFGLEQGFTLSGPPGEKNGERLRLEIALGGNLTASVWDGKTLVLADASGKEAFRYAGLAVLDADGTGLPARLSVSGGRLVIDADDTDARYPVIIDPWIQTKLTASDGTTGDHFGYSVSVSGDTAVVGAYFHDTSSNLNQGAAYVFEKSGTGWTDMIETAKLTASDGAAYDYFGYSVSISGDTAVVGAYGHNTNGNWEQGAAYVFEKPGTGWGDMTQTAKLIASDGAADDYFGFSVSVSGDTAVVGADGHDTDGNSDQGAAYVFEKSGTGWSDMAETAKLTASDGAAIDRFGISVSVSGDTAVVGAYGHDTDGKSEQGAAYVFEKPGTDWGDMTQTAKLTASDGAESDYFGCSVSVSGDTAVVGTDGHETDGNSFQGAAYVFEKPGTGWDDMTQTAKLTASDGGEDNYFGGSVSVSDDTVVVGAYGHNTSGNWAQGAAYVFEKPGTGWDDMTQTAKLNASDGAAGDWFGHSVSVSGETAVVGAHYHDINGNSNQGAAYVLSISLKVSTAAAASVTTSSAVLGGSVTGSEEVTAHGVCWNTSSAPDMTDSKKTMGNGTGDFSDTVTGLKPNTTYYVRAYATTSGGTTLYGDEIIFKTKPVMPTVTTGTIGDVTVTSATGCGSVTIRDGYSIECKGICWNTSNPPNLATSPHTEQGDTLGDFVSDITGLEPDTTYYVRAYAQFRSGTATYTFYGKTESFTTPPEDEALPGDVNGDEKADLADAILILQILSGIDTGDAAISTDADTDGDGRLGIPEVIHILRAISQQ